MQGDWFFCKPDSVCNVIHKAQKKKKIINVSGFPTDPIKIGANPKIFFKYFLFTLFHFEIILMDKKYLFRKETCKNVMYVPL